MLIIRAAQMKALDEAAQETFLDYMAGDIQRRWPDRFSAIGSNVSAARISASYRRAKGYGLRKKPHVAWFIFMDFLLGAEYERFPGLEWAARILQSELTADTKVHRLTRRFDKAGISIDRIARTQARARINHGE